MQAIPRNDPHRGDHHSSRRSNPGLKGLAGTGFRKKGQLEAQLDRVKSKLDRAHGTQSSGASLMAVSLSRPRPCLPVLWGH
ncbi:unnamed protein product [Microthlaspi erraticum]|uniref:Uncharacterized protein n=1 Tax=Microthlaspi erraticum TaxID=1685480 RepID=A0A6D2ITT4_9BRAS|nr:unnamed protein product [Microthlaspi erraticum]